MKAIYPDIPIGAFAENILTEGIEVAALPKGTRIIVGECVMPKEGVFAIVLKDGTIKCDDKICILSPDE